MDNKIPKKIEYRIGLFLVFFYILTSYVAVDILVPSKVNTLFLYAFLGWGAFVTLIYGIKEKLAVGSVTNMYEIVEIMEKAKKIVRP